MKTTVYQIWALLPRPKEDEPSWRPVTGTFLDRQVAEQVASLLWMETRIEVVEVDTDDEG